MTRRQGDRETRRRGQRETRHYTVDACLTLRENTERPVTVTQGTNTVAGCDPKRIVTEALVILDGKGKTGQVPELWDGRAASRIVDILELWEGAR